MRRPKNQRKWTLDMGVRYATTALVLVGAGVELSACQGDEVSAAAASSGGVGGHEADVGMASRGGDGIGQVQSALLAGDLNRDYAVNIADLQQLVNVLLGSETNPLVVGRADFDGNGSVAIGDLQQLVNLLLSCGGNGDACTCQPGDDPTFFDRSVEIAGAQRSTTDVQIADFDRDGLLDIAWASQFGGGVSPPGGIDVSFNMGGGQFETQIIGDENSIGSWSFLLPVDVDGDGYLDLVTSRPALAVGVAEVSLFLNDTLGGFQLDAAAIPLLTGGEDGIVFGRVAAMDIEGDGDQDLVVPMSFSGDFTQGRPNILLINDGTGTFSRDTQGRLPSFDPTNNYSFCVATGDVNGDGAPDLFVGEGEQRQRLLVNDGDGFFVDQSEDDGAGRPRLPPDTMRGYECQFFDVDEDGDLDVVVVNDATIVNGVPTGHPAQLFVNDGAGYFTVRTLPSAAGGPYDNRGVALGDVNGDRLPDLIIGSDNYTMTHNGHGVEVLLGQCDGTFVPAGGLPNLTQGLLGIAVADFDGDGHVDIAGAVASPDATSSYANLLLMGRSSRASGIEERSSE
ncbi:MAG: VCBS repeat-containing protein [Deltaproteobacteria bacterium]|nr:VCBS repeat-containing protein [Deltaproteobacteria bacterium]